MKYTRSHDESPDEPYVLRDDVDRRPAIPERTFYDTFTSYKDRIAEGFSAAIHWIRGDKTSIIVEPRTADEARIALISACSILEKKKIDKLAAIESTRSALDHAIKIKARMDADLADENAKVEAENAIKTAEFVKSESQAVEAVAQAQTNLRAATAEYAPAARAADSAKNLSQTVAGVHREEHPISAAAQERRAANLASKGLSLQSDAVWEAGDTKRAENRKSRLKSNTRLLVDESSYPIQWKHEPDLLGERALPVGAFAAAVQPIAKHARVVGAGGKWNSVDFADENAWKTISDMAELSTQKCRKAGRPIAHVAHGVLAKPKNSEGGIQKWSLPEANRAARHYLRSLGADPAKHDYVVVVHSDKKEEAVHVIWNRVRDDGMIHRNDNAWVSAALGRARWDQYAGIDPARISTSDSGKKPVRDGFKKIRDDSLSGEYFSPNSKKIEIVPLIGRAHASALAAEGAPNPGECAGTWTAKEGYRDQDEIRWIFSHVLGAKP